MIYNVLDSSQKTSSHQPSESTVQIAAGYGSGFYGRRGKRVLDVAGAIILLLLFSPIILVISLLQLTQAGGVLFTHTRIGRFGEEFGCLKFRTLVPDADLRLTEEGRKLGLVDDHRWGLFCDKVERMEQESQRLRSTWINPKHAAASALNEKLKTPLSREHNLEELLRRPELDYTTLMAIEGIGPGIEHEQAAEQVEIQTKYAGYIERQKDEIQKQLRNEHTRLPLDLDYAEVSGLSNEVIAKLNEARPETLGQASRISGVTPAAISILLVHLKKRGLLRKSA